MTVTGYYGGECRLWVGWFIFKSTFLGRECLQNAGDRELMREQEAEARRLGYIIRLSRTSHLACACWADIKASSLQEIEMWSTQ